MEDPDEKEKEAKDSIPSYRAIGINDHVKIEGLWNNGSKTGTEKDVENEEGKISGKKDHRNIETVYKPSEKDRNEDNQNDSDNKKA